MQLLPDEVIGSTATVHSAGGTLIVPESAAVCHCAVVVVVTVGIRVIVTVVRGEHMSVLVAERISTGVTRVPGHTKGVVGLFR